MLVVVLVFRVRMGVEGGGREFRVWIGWDDGERFAETSKGGIERRRRKRKRRRRREEDIPTYCQF